MPVTMFFVFINTIWNIELYCIVLKGDKLVSDKGDTEIYMGNEFKDHEHIIFFPQLCFSSHVYLFFLFPVLALGQAFGSNCTSFRSLLAFHFL